MSAQTSVFISWSGDLSKQVAEVLRDWLPLIVETPDYWVSSRDLPDGTRWVSELSKQLEISHFGILVITRDNTSSPWLLFEAGALSKSIQQGRLIPYLVSSDKKSLSGPLSQFQALIANHGDTLRLVESICKSVPNPPTKSVIKKRFKAFWPELEKDLANLVKKLVTPPSEDFEKKEVKNDISVLRSELSDTTELLRQLVENWTETPVINKKQTNKNTIKEIHPLEGSWRGGTENSHLYIRFIRQMSTWTDGGGKVVA